MTHGDPSIASSSALGGAVLDLVDNTSDWVRRRVENLTFLDDRTIHREVFLHLHLRPGRSPMARPDGSAPIPLLRLQRGAHTAFTVTDQSGRLLPFANHEEERQLIVDGIMDRLGGTLAGSDAARGWVTSSIKKYHKPTFHSRLYRFLRPIAGEVFELESPSSEKTLADQANSLFPQVAAIELAKAVAEVSGWVSSHLLIALVPVRDLSCPFVLHISYLESIPPRRISIRHPRTLLLATTRLIGGTLSWGTRVPMEGLTRASTFHINAFAPPGFRVIDAGLRYTGPPPDDEPLWVLDDDRLPSTGHVVWRRPDPAFRGDFFLSLYANKTGIFMESLCMTVVVATLIIAFTRRLSDLKFDFARFDPNFAAAMLLLVPAALVAVMTYKDSSRIASRALALTRLTLFVEAAALLGCALPFAFRLPPNEARHLWYCAAYTGLLACSRQLVSCAVHAWRLSKLHLRIDRWKRKSWVLRKRMIAASKGPQTGVPA